LGSGRPGSAWPLRSTIDWEESVEARERARVRESGAGEIAFDGWRWGGWGMGGVYAKGIAWLAREEGGSYSEADQKAGSWGVGEVSEARRKTEARS